MKIVIKYIVKSDTYFFPGSYHKIEIDSLNDQDQQLLNKKQKDIKKHKPFLFIVNSHQPHQKPEDYTAVLEGMVGRLEVIDNAFFVFMVGKAKLYNHLPDDGSKIIPEVFLLAGTDEKSDELDANFLELAKESLIINGFEDYEKLDDLVSQDSFLYYRITYFNHFIGLENIQSRKVLFEYYDYIFFMKFLVLIMKYTKGYLINYDGINTPITNFFNVVESLKKAEENKTQLPSHCKVLYKDRNLKGQYFYDINEVYYELDIDDQGKNLLQVSNLKEVIKTPMDYFNVFHNYYLETPEKRKKAHEFNVLLDKIEETFKKKKDVTSKDVSNFWELFESKISEDDNLSNKKILSKEERNELYHKFLQMEAKFFYPAFKALNHIPESIRKGLEVIDFQNSSGQKEKQRLLNILRLPWDYKTIDHDIKTAKEILDQDHYGLESVKRKILEYITLLKYAKNVDSKILCLYGPPGTGKTSIAKNIAKALGRNYASLSLGSISSELDIQGINASYVGASPGGIINQMIQAGSQNPVFLLDEIDKIPSKSNTGNIVGILMHVLDATLNQGFVDSFLNVPYDLSQALFICTANDLAAMPAPLRNRIDIVNIDAYTAKEKKTILKKYIIPKRLKNLDIDYEITFKDEALNLITERYALDSGMRDSQRYITSIFSQILMHNEAKRKKITHVDEEIVKTFLGDRAYKKKNFKHYTQGIVNLLSASSIGGSIIKLEVASYPGKGNIITTGNLEKIANESCHVAFGYLHANSNHYRIPSKRFDDQDFHFHFSEGSTSKDGPSGGVGICIAMYADIKKKRVSHHVAFTGELTLKGKVLPIGGLTNKLKVCEYEGIKTVYLPLENKEEVESMKLNLSKKLRIVYVDNISEIIKNLF